MRRVFADTAYWVALTVPTDQWFEAAVRARKALGPDTCLVTTEEVLSEFLNCLSDHGHHIRELAAELVRDMLNSRDVTVLRQSHDSFSAGLKLYERRLDKGFSLTDCISMSAMEEEGLQEVLTPDRHFGQAGFSVLMQ